MHSASKMYMIRLKPHDDLRESLLQFARDHSLDAAVLTTCVGSLEQYHLRFANQSHGIKRTGHFEILSLAGTLSARGSHLHLSVADENGEVTGGHLLDGNLIYTTAEIAIAELTTLRFERAEDPSYGYHELVITPKPAKPQP